MTNTRNHVFADTERSVSEILNAVYLQHIHITHRLWIRWDVKCALGLPYGGRNRNFDPGEYKQILGFCTFSRLGWFAVSLTREIGPMGPMVPYGPIGAQSGKEKKKSEKS